MILTWYNCFPEEPLPSVEDITNIIQFLSVKDVILIAQMEIVCLNDISLEGDIANNILL
jgi:hypothetical protein